MSRLAVMAHYDPLGRVAPHVRRHVLALCEAVEDLHVVSTAELRPPDRSWLRRRARLTERTNVGYDFYSYKAGLDAATDLGSYDEVVLCNDTYVGPLRDYGEIFEEMARCPVDFWGLSASQRIRPHVQSFFVAFRPWVSTSRAFTRFWSDMTPLDDRQSVIHHYEVGLTAALADAGFVWQPYFHETEREHGLARRRVAWWALHRRPIPHSRRDVRRLTGNAREPWNPAIGLADSALADGRLPYVKLDTLRYDPYGLDTERLLTLCERSFPDTFDGVRDYLHGTREHYPPRPREALRPTPSTLRPLHRLVAYGQAS